MFEEFQVVFCTSLPRRGFILMLQVQPGQLSRTTLAGHLSLCAVNHSRLFHCFVWCIYRCFFRSQWVYLYRARKRCCKKMLSKKLKIDSQCRKYNESWLGNCFVKQHGSKVLYVICNDVVDVIMEYNINDNFWEKNLCHSRDSNHRSPVFRTGALTT